MEARAISRYQRVSAKKIGRILHLIREQDVTVALSTLKFLNKPTKMPVLKALQSAVANAVAKAGKARLEEKDLVVSEARVGSGPAMKRWQAGARGSGMRFKHRTSHIYIAVRSKTKEPEAKTASSGSERS
jgi:large subunit ribosomal protein L22